LETRGGGGVVAAVLVVALGGGGSKRAVNALRAALEEGRFVLYDRKRFDWLLNEIRRDPEAWKDF